MGGEWERKNLSYVGVWLQDTQFKVLEKVMGLSSINAV